MREASKTNAIRSDAWKRRYLSGRVLDIGAGDDPVCPTAEIFDRAQGDAEHILSYLTENSYDCVHSSHTLEHMKYVHEVIRDWWRLVRPGGWFVTVVPDCTLYEQGFWPSRWNADHKWAFDLFELPGPSYRIGLVELVRTLPGAKLISAELQDYGYDYALRDVDQTLGEALAQLQVVCRKL